MRDGVGIAGPNGSELQTLGEAFWFCCKSEIRGCEGVLREFVWGIALWFRDRL